MSCFDLAEGISSFSGRFSSGKANGQGRVAFDYDHTTLDGPFKDGLLAGKVTQGRNEVIELVANFVGGRAHGPAWVIPQRHEDEGYLFAHFSQGQIVEGKVAHLTPDLERLRVGTLVNGTFLRDSFEVEVSGLKTGEMGCVQSVDLSEVKRKEGTEIELFRLPVIVKCFPQFGRVFIRSSKTLVFNRIAKTGSQSITELLVQLQKKNGVEPRVIIKEVRKPIIPKIACRLAITRCAFQAMAMAGLFLDYQFVEIFIRVRLKICP